MRLPLRMRRLPLRILPLRKTGVRPGGRAGVHPRHRHRDGARLLLFSAFDAFVFDRLQRLDRPVHLRLDPIEVFLRHLRVVPHLRRLEVRLRDRLGDASHVAGEAVGEGVPVFVFRHLAAVREDSAVDVELAVGFRERGAHRAPHARVLDARAARRHREPRLEPERSEEDVLPVPAALALERLDAAEGHLRANQTQDGLRRELALELLGGLGEDLPVDRVQAKVHHLAHDAPRGELLLPRGLRDAANALLPFRDDRERDASATTPGGGTGGGAERRGAGGARGAGGERGGHAARDEGVGDERERERRARGVVWIATESRERRRFRN